MAGPGQHTSNRVPGDYLGNTVHRTGAIGHKRLHTQTQTHKSRLVVKVLFAGLSNLEFCLRCHQFGPVAMCHVCNESIE